MRRNLKNSVLALLLALTMVLSLTNSAVAAGVGKTSNAGLTLEEVDNSTVAPVVADKVDKEQELELVSTEKVRVFVVLDGKSVVESGFGTKNLATNKKAMKLVDTLEKQQDVLAKKISKEALLGEKLSVKNHFTLLSNAFSTVVREDQIEAIKKVKGVSDVVVMAKHEVMEETAEPNMGTAGDMVGAPTVWNNGYTGAGQRLVVIDTGIDADHPSFDSDAFEYGLKKTLDKTGKKYDLLSVDEIKGVWDKLHASKFKAVDDPAKTYLGSKIPFAVNYIDEDLDVTHDNDTQGEHGTHVSGITTANTYVKAANGSYEKQANGVQGVAPDAQLITMKVFGKGGGVYTEDYMLGIEDALLLNADAINLSLGAVCGDTAPEEEYIAKIMKNLETTDTVVSISAGNSGRWADESAYGANLWFDVDMSTAGTPGTYANAFTVASCVNKGYTGLCANFNESTNVVYNDGGSEYGCKPITSLDTTGKGTSYDYVLLTGMGKPEDFANVDVKGKIVLVSRGEISFFEKYNNAYDAGAKALIVYNNQAGTIGMNLTGKYENADMPAVSITLADAQAIVKGATEANGAYVGKVEISGNITTVDAPDGYSMSDFSSYGVNGSLELKPEITAPGGNIYATLDKGQYGLMSGTSMAAPSICGQSGLVSQYIKETGLKEKTGLTIRALTQSLLMSTSTPLVEADGEEYSPRVQGSGLGNADLATKTPAYLLVGDKAGNDGKVKVQLGDDPSKKGNYTFSFTVNNMTDKVVGYHTDASILTEELVQKYFLTGTDYKLNPTVKFTASKKGNLYDITLDGVVDEADAVALETYAADKTDKFIAKHESKFDFDGNGTIEKADADALRALIADGKAPVEESDEVVYVDGNGVTTVKVNVKLSKADKEYLAQFPSGMYVEGFVYLHGNVDLSLPMLAFYGQWSDSSMYDPFDYLEYANKGDVYDPYNGQAYNFMEYQLPGSTTKYKYSSNLFAQDNKYVADRNALAKGGVVAAMDYTLIRSAARVITTVKDAKTGTVYFSKTEGGKQRTFYSASAAAYRNIYTKTELGWNGTDKKGKDLKNGTKVIITVKAIPEYYNGKKASEVKGAGLEFSIPMTIDNTKPEATTIGKAKSGKISLTVKDNRYVAAVNVIDADKTTVLKTYAVNQTKANTKKTVKIDAPKKVFYIQVVDYAGNAKTYRVNNSGKKDTKIVKSVSLNKTAETLIKGNQMTLVATCAPAQLVNDQVTWKSSNTKVATVSKSGIVTAKAQGVATITATTVAKNSKGKQLKATCKVEVKSIEKDLKAAVWDENGSVYFSTFNTATLPEYNKVSEKQSIRVLAATEVADGKLFVATGEGDDKAVSKLYIVDPANNYSATEIGEGISECYDLTYSAESNTVYAAYGPYVVKYDAKTGKSLGYLETTGKFAGQIAGLAYAGGLDVSGLRVDYLYVVSTEGELGFVISEVGGTKYGAAKICDLGVAASYNFNSLYCDPETGMLFWSNYASGASNSVMYAIEDTSTAEENSAKIFELGSFPNGVWPVTGLH